MIDWQHPGKPVILASQSPRRSSILSLMGITFTSCVPDETIDEAGVIDSTDLIPSLRRLASVKAESVAMKYPEALVLGADTVVVRSGRILGKPADRDEAEEMLRFLSGNCHVVYTAVALVCKESGFSASDAAATNVYFRKLDESEICSYLQDKEYLDKAGAYAIQGKAMIFIDKIEGCFYNVMGLPVTETLNLFKAFLSRKDSADV